MDFMMVGVEGPSEIDDGKSLGLLELLGVGLSTHTAPWQPVVVFFTSI
jgi:hypothetical protein